MALDINRLSWLIGGEAGYGIMTAGEKFARAMVQGGLNIHTHVEYPSLIRGGHNSFGVRVEEDEVTCPILMYNLIVALNKDTINRHKDFLTAGGGIVYDASEIKLQEGEIRSDIKLYDVPLMKLVNETKGGIRVMRNSVAVGASMAILDYDFTCLAEAIRGVNNRRLKGSKIAEINVHIAKKGYDYIKKNFQNDFEIKLEKRPRTKKMLIRGNEAIALGAIKAGCKFMSAYPMTPASSIMGYFVRKEKEAKVVMKQADDEITAINMALGASFAGVRSMTATSGGGLALMTETTSLVGISEVPLVIVNVQRPGPATGLPTRQGQGDLKFVLNIGHGEFPRILIAPGDAEECFYETFNAFNLADKYQLPVFIVSDKHLAASYKSVKEFDTKNLKIDRGWLLSDEEANQWVDYKRFMNTDSGVSPRAIPGQKTLFRSSSDEHNEYGNICENPDNRLIQDGKRFRKLDTALSEIPLPKLYGPQNADVTIVGWGSTKGAILEAMKYLKEDGIKANFLHFVYIYPMHVDYVKRFLKNAKKVVNVEENVTAQLAGIIREFTGFKIKHKVLKHNGRTLYPSEIYDGIKKVYND
ncbi:2-oxoacid:acceptor oxidoreductase subunit alpha [archaeon]|nr:2-oxoacid:acceptor oxidoreductase subunit alpha [archaeon]MBL7056856.1 2-oxoacid:acceptor oxidoreductase subunit alpha [Candidatus Woesearchaeota archaeon]